MLPGSYKQRHSGVNCNKRDRENWPHVEQIYRLNEWPCTVNTSEDNLNLTEAISKEMPQNGLPGAKTTYKVPTTVCEMHGDTYHDVFPLTSLRGP